jgi:hypothetical protein
MLKEIAMSRLPLRNLFRLVHSGLEKATLACAAFGLIHATAKADERGPAEVSLQDPWSNPAAQPAHLGDAWGTLASRGAAPEDGWAAPLANRAGPSEQGVAITSMTTPVATPSALVNDRSDWNDIPRARSPGLIAANDAWRSRVVTGAEWNNAPIKASKPTPAETRDKALSTDPWLAPQPGIAAAATPGAGSAPFDAGTQWDVAVKPSVWLSTIRGSVDTSTPPRAMQSTPLIQGEARKGDWSIFAGASRLNSREQGASSIGTDSSQPHGQTKTSPRAVVNDFVGVRGRVTMTPDDGRYPSLHETSAGTLRGSWAASAMR